MQEDVIFRYKNGRIIPIKVKQEQTTNDYMNDKIRKKLQPEDELEKDYEGELELKKDDYEIVDNELVRVKNDTYYQLYNGEKIEFMDKSEYKKMTDNFYNSLTPEEKQAISIWVGDPRYMSEHPMYTYKEGFSPDKIMDRVFKEKAVVLDKDTLLFRRASDDYLDLINGVNHEYAMSTSAYDTIPKTLPSGIKFGEKELYILAPKGTRILPIEKVAVNDPNNEETDKRIYTRQHEVVLPKGTSYEVVKDLSTYYKRPAKGNEIGDKVTTDQRYVVKLTNKKYPKVDYKKPEYRYNWNDNGYESYVYKHKGKDIEIKEEYVGEWSTNRTPKPRQEVVKYKVWQLGFKNQPEYYDTYSEAVDAINKYL